MDSDDSHTKQAVFSLNENTDTALIQKISKETAEKVNDSDPNFADQIGSSIREMITQDLSEIRSEIHTTEHFYKSEIKMDDDQLKVIVRDRTDEHAELVEERDRFKLAKVQHFIGKKITDYTHHFNNYLAVIIGNLEIFLINNQFDPEKINFLISESKKESKICENIMKMILPAAHQLEDIYITDSLDTVTNTLEVIYKKENISIQKDYSPNLPKVYGDNFSLRLLWFNLLVNSYESIKEKGEQGIITISVAPYENKIRVPYDNIEVKIKDNGKGMDKEMLKLWKCLEPGYVTRKKEGHGIGRKTFCEAIEQHNIAYSIESKAEKGTQFSFYFKRVEEDFNPK